MQFRRARLDDYDKIVELQDKNLLTNVDPFNLANGFLATAFSASQFKQMNEEMSVVVCEHNQKICGYLGSCNLQFFREFPIIASMLNRLANATYRGAQLDFTQLLVANPVCIEEEYRGKGIYLGLCKTIIPYFPKKYVLAVTLVPVENKRSFTATSRLGFEIVEKFEVNGRPFHTMVLNLHEFARLMRIR